MPSSRTTMPFSPQLQDVQIRMRQWLRWCDVHGLRFEFLCCWKVLQGVPRLWFGISKSLAIHPRHRDSGCCPGSVAMEGEKHRSRGAAGTLQVVFHRIEGTNPSSGANPLTALSLGDVNAFVLCVSFFRLYFYTISFNSILRFSSLILSSFRNSKANFGQFLQPCERPLMPHLPGRSHTLRPFSSHSRVWRELWTFNASSTLGIEMHSWHHEMASCKFQIVGFYHFGLNDFECFQSLSGT